MKVVVIHTQVINRWKSLEFVKLPSDSGSVTCVMAVEIVVQCLLYSFRGVSECENTRRAVILLD